MRICIPIKGSSLPETEKLLKKAGSLKFSRKLKIFAEIWLDNLAEADLKTLFKKSKHPVVAVCKSKEERGDFKGTEKQRVEVLMRAAQAGARIIDIGIHTNVDLIEKLKRHCKNKKVLLIISRHFWDKTPDIMKLEKMAAGARKLGADIVKIAANVRKWSDNTTLFEFTKRTEEDGKNAIVIGMGQRGRISRFGCLLLGGYLTYAAIDEKSKTAGGQLMVEELKGKCQRCLCHAES